MPDEQLARALGAKIRRDIIHLLLKKELSVHDIGDTLGIGEVNASKHLKKLYDLGILKTYTQGRERYYAIKHGDIVTLIKWYDKVAEQIGESS